MFEDGSRTTEQSGKKSEKRRQNRVIKAIQCQNVETNSCIVDKVPTELIFYVIPG